MTRNHVETVCEWEGKGADSYTNAMQFIYSFQENNAKVSQNHIRLRYVLQQSRCRRYCVGKDFHRPRSSFIFNRIPIKLTSIDDTTMFTCSGTEIGSSDRRIFQFNVTSFVRNAAKRIEKWESIVDRPLHSRTRIYVNPKYFIRRIFKPICLIRVFCLKYSTINWIIQFDIEDMSVVLPTDNGANANKMICNRASVHI